MQKEYWTIYHEYIEEQGVDHDHSSTNHHVKRAPDVETCCEEKTGFNKEMTMLEMDTANGHKCLWEGIQKMEEKKHKFCHSGEVSSAIRILSNSLLFKNHLESSPSQI